MILFGRRHPTKLTLSRYSDGDLSARRSRRVGRHVERCAECREYVGFIRELGTVARQLDSPRVRELVDADIRRELRGRRDRGERTPADRMRSLESLVVVAALVLVGGGYLLFAPSATATRGELSFGSVESAVEEGRGAAPVEYSPAYYLAGEDSLRLRVEVTRDAGGDLGPRVETRTTTLRRGRGGEFRGSLPIEQGDLFAAGAVEDFEGAHLDTNAGRLWPLHVALDRGRPSLAALEAHYRSLESYNWVLAIDWAERLAAERPHDPLAWTVLYWNLSRGAGADTSGATRNAHRARLDELIERAGPGDLEALPWLVRYAGALGADRLRDSLLAELDRRDPEHPAVLDRRVLDAATEAPFGSRELVDRFEELWRATPQGTELLVHFGVQSAAAAGESAALDAWIERGLRHPDVDLEELLAGVEPFDPGGARRAKILRARLAELAAADPDEQLDADALAEL
ncbi:MAG: zf-HC2 domain-containing protein, partial [Gemmatimonadota bacterium]